MKPEKITELKGILCRSIDGKSFFRTTAEDGTVRDFRIAHCDLSITIKDDDAFAYCKNGEWIIDHSPQTLGLVVDDGE